MMKLFTKIIFGLVLATATLLSTNTFAQKVPTLELYHGATCPHCHREIKWLNNTLNKMYPDLQVNEFEVWNSPANKAQMDRRLTELGTSSDSVPTNIIENQVIVGFNKDKLIQAFKEAYGTPAISAEEVARQSSLWYRIKTWFAGLFGE